MFCIAHIQRCRSPHRWLIFSLIVSHMFLLLLKQQVPNQPFAFNYFHHSLAKRPSIKDQVGFFVRTIFWFSRMQYRGHSLHLCPKPFLWYHLLSLQLYQRVIFTEIIIFPSLEVGSGCDLTFWNRRSCLWSKEICEQAGSSHSQSYLKLWAVFWMYSQYSCSIT